MVSDAACRPRSSVQLHHLNIRDDRSLALILLDDDLANCRVVVPPSADFSYIDVAGAAEGARLASCEIQLDAVVGNLTLRKVIAVRD